MYRVKKRDGKITDFDIQKIINALRKAFEGSHRQYNDDIISMLALRVTVNFESSIIDGCIDVEDIQDSAEKVLSECGYSDVAKAYILYRKQREYIRNIDKSSVDYRQIVDSYLNSVSWKGEDGTDSDYSIGGLIMSNSGAVTGNYWLSEIYDQEITQAHRNGDLYIHDLNMLTGHSTGWSLRQFIQLGMSGVKGNISCGPARHLNTLCEQMVRFLGIIHNEWAGSQTFISFDTCLAPFVKCDQLSFAQVKQCIQTFVYGVNTPLKWGYEPPHTNIVLDWSVPSDMADEPAITAGTYQEFTYGECQKEMDMINAALLEVMREGDFDGKQFRYPQLIVMVDDAFFHHENASALASLALAGNAVEFVSCMRRSRNRSDVRQLLRCDKPDLRRLYRNTGENTGTFGIVTLNIPRMAVESNDEEQFFTRLDHFMDITTRSLHTKKTVLTKLMENGLYPYTGHYLKTLQKHFGMIGVTGMKQAYEHVSHDTWKTCEMFETAVLQHMRERLKSYQKKYDTLFGIECVQSFAPRSYLAGKDRQSGMALNFAEVDGVVSYSSDISRSDDLFETMDHGEKILSLYTSGGVFHLDLKESMSGDDLCMFLAKIMSAYDIPYLSL